MNRFIENKKGSPSESKDSLFFLAIDNDTLCQPSMYTIYKTKHIKLVYKKGYLYIKCIIKII
ncbi:hypothetical protein BTT_60090 (plasmid) [Bacillus thuringiensis serovar morrisoni str. 4AA1]|nr:hypothetical protein BTT_60090 [Bacillus thuringiensis serovar morrisoni str. 4AA1]